MDTIRVKPEQLKSAANDIKTINNEANKITDQMVTLINGTSKDWLGDASKTYRDKFAGLKDDMTKIKTMLEEHVNDLNTMAANYDQAEQSAVDLSSSLDTNPIV